MGNTSLILNSESYLSSHEAGRVSGYTPDYITRLCREGQLESQMVGRVRYISKSSLDEFLQRKRSEKDIYKSNLSDSRKKYYRENSFKRWVKDVIDREFFLLFGSDFAHRASAFFLSVGFVFSLFFFVSSFQLISGQAVSVVDSSQLLQKTSQTFRAFPAYITFTYESVRTDVAKHVTPVVSNPDIVFEQIATSVFSDVEERKNAAMYAIHSGPQLDSLHQIAYGIQHIGRTTKDLLLFDSEKWQLVSRGYSIVLSNSVTYFDQGIKQLADDADLAVPQRAVDLDTIQDNVSLAVSDIRSSFQNLSIHRGVVDQVADTSQEQLAGVFDAFKRGPINGFQEVAKSVAGGIDDAFYEVAVLFNDTPDLVPQPSRRGTNVVVSSPETVVQVIERPIVVSGPVSNSNADIDIRFEQVYNELAKIRGISEAADPATGTSIINNYNTFSQINKIDDLGNVTIHNSSITSTGASLTSLGVTGTATSSFAGGIRIASSGFQVEPLANCDTIDTDANGVFSCGTDATGAAGSGDHVFPFTVDSGGVSTSTLTIFSAGIISNAASSTITNLFSTNATSTNATSTSVHVATSLGVATSSASQPFTVEGDVRFGEGDLYNGLLFDATNGRLSLGTSSPFATQTIWGQSTGKIFEAVTSASSSALSISATGFGTTTVSGLNISGSATTTSNVGINLTTGCFAVNGTCIESGGGGSADHTFPWSVAADLGGTAVSTSTLLGLEGGFVSTASSTIAAALTVTGQGTFTNFLSTNATTTNATTTNLNLSGSTANRLLQTNGASNLSTVADLTTWIAGTTNELSVADDGDGTVTLSLPDTITVVGATTTGALSVTSDLFVGGAATTSIKGSTTATSTFAGGVRIDNLGLTIDALASCDTIDTDASGHFICGSDADSGDHAFPFTAASAFGATAVSTSSISVFTNGFYSSASSTVTGLLNLTNATATQLSLTNLFISDDNITDFVGTGLALSGTTLTTTLGTDIAAGEIADGDHGDFTYSSGSATLDANVVQDNEIDYSAVTLADFTNDRNFSSFPFTAAPAFGSGAVSTSSTVAFTNGLISTASSTVDAALTVTGQGTFTNFLSTNATTTNATTTNLFVSGSIGDNAATTTFAGGVRIDNLGLTVDGLTNCNTIDTDATGHFICGNDATGAGGGIDTVEENDVQVGDQDISTLDFGLGFDVSESPDTEVNVSLDLLEYVGAASTTLFSAHELWVGQSATTSIDSAGNVVVGGNITLGSTQWNTGDNIDGEIIADDTIDDDSIDLVDVTLADFTNDTNFVTFPWSLAADLGATAVSTSTLLGLEGGFVSTASSTFTGFVDLANASATQFTATDIFVTTIGQPSATTTFAGGVRIDNLGLTVDGLTSCDTIDTDATGHFICGSDDSGGGGADHTFPFDVASAYGASAVSTSTLTAFTGGIISNAASSTIQGLNGTNLVYTNATTTNATSTNLKVISTFEPTVTDAVSLGTNLFNFSDLFLDSGGVVNFDSGDVTITHAANLLTLAGGNLDLTANNITTGGIFDIDVDGTAIDAAGSLTLGAGADAAIYFDGTDLQIETNGAGASGIVFNSEDDTYAFEASDAALGDWDTGGFNLVSGDTFQINNTDVLSATTLGSGVLTIGSGSATTTNSGGVKVDALGLQVDTLTSCDSIDTDSTGFFVCGSDADSGDHAFPFTAAPAFGATAVSTSTLTAFTGGIISNAASSTIQGLNGTNLVYTNATTTNATSTNLHISSELFISGDVITDFVGTGLALSGTTLTTTLGTDIAAGEIADGDHGDFTYSSGSATLDANVVQDNEIDYSAVTLADFTNDTNFVTFPWSLAADLGATAVSTSTLLGLEGGFVSTASSTFTGFVDLANASATQFTATDIFVTTIGQPSATTTFAGGVRIDNLGLTVDGLTSCDTIDTDATGHFICGSDDSGGGGADHTFPFDVASAYGASAVSTSTLTAFTGGIISNAASSTIQGLNGTNLVYTNATTTNATSTNLKVISTFEPTVTDAVSLGTNLFNFSDLFLDSGGVVNFDSGDVTITHAANALSFAGVTGDYSFDDSIVPASDDGAALGASGTEFSDLFLNSGGVINFEAGDVTLTHASNVLTLDGGGFIANEAGAAFDFRVEGDTTPNLFTIDGGQDVITIATSTKTAGSVITIAATSTETSKLLSLLNDDATIDGDEVFSITDEGLVSIGSAGVSIADDGDGALTFTGLGNGSDENLILNLDDTSNEWVWSSGTSVATSTYSSIAISAPNVRASSLTSCDTIDTDSSGYFICGSDDGGGGGADHTFPFDVASAYGASAVSTSTLTVFSGGLISNAASSTLQGLNTTNATTTGIAKIFADGSAIGAAGALTFGADSTGDAAIYWNGTNFEFDTSAAFDFSVSGTSIGDWDTGGLNLVTGDTFQINGTDVLSATTLGSGVVNSSLTSVGTITTGVWEATDIGIAHGGTATSTFQSGGVVFYDGSTLAQNTPNFFWDETNQRLGLGTTSPNNALQIANSVSPQLLLTDFSGGVNLKHFYASSTQGSLTFGEVNDNLSTLTERVRIDAGGNVGIGTSSPYARLSVTDTVSTPQAVVAYDATRFTELQTDATGNLIVNPSGDDVFLNDDNLWVCTGGSCPSGTPSGTGSIIAESRIGVGTTTSSHKLSIETQDNSTDFLQIASSTENAVFNIDSRGWVGIGSSTPTSQVSIRDLLFVGANGTTGLGVATSTFQGDLTITGKLDVSTIDPVYTIEDTKYATYGHSTIGIKEEVLANVMLDEYDESTGKYVSSVAFSDVEEGSDLWLFYQITSFGKEWSDLVVSLTPSFDGNVFYEKNVATNTLTIMSDKRGEVSMRLVADRYDAAVWPNLRPDQNQGFEGHVIPQKR